MKIKDTVLHELLLDAQNNETLVVFAGAGVSMNPPSNLPDFGKLANEIVSGSLKQEKDEPFDRFLGRANNKSINIHQRAKDILCNPDSEPNTLHKSLLMLFSSPEKIRIVTTNFDSHFTTITKQASGNSVEIYYAPALPLGHNFNGIVYLHGSVEKTPEQMILTDSDFGRAYLTEGWARRFLQDMFTRYTILFVGYSYGDPVMQYLIRGLPPNNKKHFALIHGKEEHWKHLGITPISYSSENNHTALGETIAGWVEFSKMGTLDHAQRIRNIVESNSLPSQEDEDYLERILKEPSTVLFFANYAKNPKWLEWIEGKKIISSLFNPEIQLNDIERELALWFAQKFVCEYPDEALAVIQRHGQRLNSFLWYKIADRLFSCDPHPEASILTKWIIILLQFPYSYKEFKLLDYILNKCRYPEDNFTALLLFEYLTKPQVILEKGFTSSEDNQGKKVTVKLYSRGNEHWLTKAWGNFFKPHLDDFAKRLEPVVTNYLTQAHFLLNAWDRGNEKWDSNSLHRSAIESHEQDKFRENIDILIDAARDIIEWYLKDNHQQAICIINSWIDSDVPLLKRLAVHGMTKSEQVIPDEKISWIIKHILIYANWLKHEIFMLIKEAYPKSVEASRLSILKLIEQGPGQKEKEPDRESIRQNKIYNLLFWLNQSAPECLLTNQQFEVIKKTYPNFKPIEHPDLDYYMSDFECIGNHSPVTVEELLNKSPTEENIEWLLVYEKRNKWGDSERDGLLNTLKEATAKSYAWSMQWVTALQDKNKWNSDIWESFFRGWENSSLNEEQWLEIYIFLKKYPQLYKFTRLLSRLLKSSIDKFRDKRIPSFLENAEEVAEKLWDIADKSEETIPDNSNDWDHNAINHEGGTITMFWLYDLSKRKSVANKDWTGISDKHKAFLQKILSGSSYIAELGRVMLSSQMHFLFSLDENWTKQNVLPLLDWDINQRRAQQAWHGYLVGGQWNNVLVSNIIPLYEKTFSKLASDLAEWQDRFCKHLSAIAVYGSINPLQEGWLIKFLNTSTPENRKTWAAYMSNQIASLREDDRKENLWNRWLKDYWSKRITGIPCPLEREELESMIDWTPHLIPVFPAVVDMICNSIKPDFILKDTDIFWKLGEEDIDSKHPRALIKILEKLLKHTQKQQFWYFSEVEKIVQKLANNSGIKREELKSILDEMAKLGHIINLENK